MIDLRESHSPLTLDDNYQELKANITYKYVDPITEKKLVLKITDFDDGENDDIFIISEFRKMILLSTEPEIAQVYNLRKIELVNNDIRSCYTMEYIEGDTLKEFLKNKDLSIEQTLDLLAQIASGLEKAHHYGICHMDLHSENIIINSLGYSKLIDFHFRETKLDAGVQTDIKSFIKIIEEFEIVCNDSVLIALKQHCKNIQSFKSLAFYLRELKDIIWEYNIIGNDKSKKLLSKIILDIGNNFNLNMLLQEKNKVVPQNYIRELTPQEIEYYQKRNYGAFEYMDSLLEDVDIVVKNKFEQFFSQLLGCHLCRYEVGVINSGEVFRGPYEYFIDIFPSSKLLRWKRINDKIKFIKDSENNYHQIIFEN
jgi:hypothetical protein